MVYTVFHCIPVDVAGQLTADLVTCPGEIFTFRCNVTGNMSGYTIWRVNGNSQCALLHRSTSSSICGPGNAFRARPGIEFATSATTYSSTLSGTRNFTLNGTLVECFGPANNVEPRNMVGRNTLQILGQYIKYRQLSLHEDSLGKVATILNMYPSRNFFFLWLTYHHIPDSSSI